MELDLERLVERMTYLASSNTSKPVGRRLYELLEEPQEPFLMEVYLLENGCSGRMIRSQSSPFCWPLNADGKRLRKFGSHGGTRRSRAAGFLRRVLVKVVYRKTFMKVLHLDRNTTSKNRSSIFDLLSVESKDQLSPVSVLVLQHSDESSPLDKQNESPLPSSMDSPREISIASKETHAHKKANFSNKRRLLFDRLREAEERIFSFHSCLDPDMFEDSMMNELSFSWEREKGDDTSLTQIVASESSKFRNEWKHFKPETRKIGLCLETSILDDLKEEAIFDMLNSNFH